MSRCLAIVGNSMIRILTRVLKFKPIQIRIRMNNLCSPGLMFWGKMFITFKTFPTISPLLKMNALFGAIKAFLTIRIIFTFSPIQPIFKRKLLFSVQLNFKRLIFFVGEGF